MSTQSNTPKLHRAAVITPGVSYRGDGSIGSVRPGTESALVTILGTTRRWFEPECAIVVDGVPLEVFRAQSEAATAAGWRHSKIEPWTLFHTEDGAQVSLGVRDAMWPDHFSDLFARGTDPGVLAMNLDRFHKASGTAWRGMPVTTALAAIRLSWENSPSRPLWQTARVGPGYPTGPLEWSRHLTDDEKSWGWVHTFDANMAYLAAAGTVELAWSKLGHTGVQPFDDALPGYWLLRLAPATLGWLDDPQRPPLIPIRRRLKRGMVWVTTPVAKLLRELGDPCEVEDSWTAQPAPFKVQGRNQPAAMRILRPWAETLRDGLADAPAHLARPLKSLYQMAVGGMQRESMRIHRPDWAHTWIDHSMCNLYRRILKVHASEGVWPCAVKVDSVSYADCVSEPAALAKAIGVRGGLGGFKLEKSIPSDSWAVTR